MKASEDLLENILEKRLRELPGKQEKSELITIPRIPCDILESNRIYYEPRVVSIGPYYHGMEKYRDTEQHKVRYLRDFLSRHNVRLDVLVKEMRALEIRARQCYSGFIHLDSEQFVEMLLLDGCFVLEVLYKRLNKETDFLQDSSWILNRIVTDFLLLENQIPFFVIHKLYSISCMGLLSEKECSDSILQDLTEFAQWRAPMWVWPRQFEIPQCEIHHLIHFYQEFHVPKQTKFPVITVQSSMVRKEDPVYMMPSASDLRDAGIIFQAKKIPAHFLDITFKNEIFEMPMIGTGLDEKIIILNLIAWNAKFSTEAPKQSDNSNYLSPLSSYTILLESLLRTKNDVRLLKARGLIENNDPSDEQVASFFNHLGDLNVVSGESHYFAGLFRDIKRYYDGHWHRHRAKLIRDYFHSPWSSISVVAGIILLFLTGIQAFCAMGLRPVHVEISINGGVVGKWGPRGSFCSKDGLMNDDGRLSLVLSDAFAGIPGAPLSTM
ncbi:hypothetical protein LUZ61_012855 [Rhynchospora tenuis]|uniref:Uncharacterized protein n=1 Tax=Rhynchospora tenuis TaxID=198213 RepID=A0AAD6F1U6_9POAL|nr:hypothetical protein LUZ61_012855 [Rhynchospora tenuis]